RARWHETDAASSATTMGRLEWAKSWARMAATCHMDEMATPRHSVICRMPPRPAMCHRKDGNKKRDTFERCPFLKIKQLMGVSARCQDRSGRRIFPEATPSSRADGHEARSFREGESLHEWDYHHCADHGPFCGRGGSLGSARLGLLVSSGSGRGVC